jgi:membrane-associated protease RseP (regulator of RpoE activity)
MFKPKTLFMSFFGIDLVVIPFIYAEDTEAVPNTYWIGVQVSPVPELLLSHFGITEESGGLIAVERVVPDGPAAKAGVKRGDVILAFGEKEIRSLPDLVEQVSKAKETATKCEVVRNGAKTTLTVTPVPRPDDVQRLPGVLNLREMPQMPPLGRRMPMNAFPGRDPQQMMRQMEEFFRQMQGGDDGDEPLIAPNGGGRKIDTGKQLSVVTQTQDGKTTIKVTAVLKDGENTEKKTGEVENVDELPEDIRGDVNMLLGR